MLLFFLFSLVGSSPEPSSVIVLSRHGARSTTKKLAGHENDFDVPLGHLTEAGRQMAYASGQTFRLMYGSPKQVTVISSSSQRALDTAHLFLEGFSDCSLKPPCSVEPSLSFGINDFIMRGYDKMIHPEVSRIRTEREESFAGYRPILERYENLTRWAGLEEGGTQREKVKNLALVTGQSVPRMFHSLPLAFGSGHRGPRDLYKAQTEDEVFLGSSVSELEDTELFWRGQGRNLSLEVTMRKISQAWYAEKEGLDALSEIQDAFDDLHTLKYGDLYGGWLASQDLLSFLLKAFERGSASVTGSLTGSGCARGPSELSFLSGHDSTISNLLSALLTPADSFWVPGFSGALVFEVHSLEGNAEGWGGADESLAHIVRESFVLAREFHATKPSRQSNANLRKTFHFAKEFLGSLGTKVNTSQEAEELCGGQGCYMSLRNFQEFVRARGKQPLLFAATAKASLYP